MLFDAARIFGWQRTDGRDTGQPAIERWRFQDHFQDYPPVVTEQTIDNATARYGGGPVVTVGRLGGVLRHATDRTGGDIGARR